MTVRFLFNIFFVFLQSWETSLGYQSVYLSASLPANIEVTSSGWTKIETWYIPAGTGHGKNGFSDSNFINGDFKVPTTGIYGIYVTLTISVRDSETYKASVWANNKEDKQIAGLSSKFKNGDGFRSLTIFGSAELVQDTFVSVHIYSDSVKQWDVLGDSDSTFGIEFVGLQGYIPGFSSNLLKQQSLKDKTWRQIGNWRTSFSTGLFKSQTGFGEGSGSFYAICDGVYQFSANVFFETIEPGRYEVAITHDGSNNGNYLYFDEQMANSSFSISVTVTLSMQKGGKVALVTKGSKKYTLSVSTGFSGVMIAPTYQRIGFSTLFSQPIQGNGALWVKIAIPKPSSGNGQFSDNINSISDGSYIQLYTNLLLVNGILLIKAESIQGVALSLGIDGSSISNSKHGIFLSRPKKGDSDSTAYCLAGLLEVPANQQLSLFIQLSRSENFEILAGSRLSVISARHSYPAFNVIYENQVQYSSRDIWLKLDKWVVKKDGSFSLVGDVGESYQVQVTGIFLISANIIFHDANGPISALISVNGDTSKRNSIYSSNGNPSAEKETLTMSGVVYLKKGSKISMQVKIEQDLSWFIAADSSFSCVYIGSTKLIPAVSTVLNNKISIFSNGWRKITGWTPQSLSQGFFESGESFNYQNGDYTIPEDGLYIVSANIQLLFASDQNAEFKLNIAINGDPSNYRFQNGLQDYHKISTSKPFTNDYYSMVVSGSIKCSKGDVISFYVYNIGDTSYDVSQDSSMSISLVSPLKTHTASGMHVMLSAGISQVMQATFSWRKVKHWDNQIGGTAPGLFLEDNLFKFENTDGTFNVIETGIYYITANVGVAKGDNDFEIGVHTSTQVSSLHTMYGRTSSSNPSLTRSSYTLKAFGILFLEKDQRISVKIRSDDSTQEWENIRLVTGWTIVRIPPYLQIPRVMHGDSSTQTIQTAPGLWSRITSWENYNSPYERSSLGGVGDGVYIIERTGLYFISINVAIDGNLNSNDFIKFKIGINGDVSSPGSQILNSGEGPSCFVGACNVFCVQTCSYLVLLEPTNTIGVYIQSSQSEILLHPASSLLIEYFQPKVPLPACFSVKLQSTQAINTQGNSALTKWVYNSDNIISYLNPAGGQIATYRLPYSGVYFAVINIELSNLNGAVDLITSLDNKQIISTSYLNNDERSFSISLHGMFAGIAGNPYSVSVSSLTDTSYTIAENSFNSLWFMGNSISGFTAQYEDDVTVTMVANKTVILDQWSTFKPNEQWLFDFTNNLQSATTFIVQNTGVYLVGGNFVIENRYATSVSTSLYVVLNGRHDYINILQARTVMNNQKWRTLEVTGEMFLEKWDTIEIGMKVDQDVVLVIKKQSIFYSALIDGHNNRIECTDNGPNVVSVLSPQETRVKFGDQLKWTCEATGQNVQYLWGRNGEVLIGETSKILELSSMKREDSGEYYCIAMYDGIQDSSNAANVYVFDPSPYFLNDIEDFTIYVKENGEQSEDLLQIQAKAESFESGDSEMSFKLLGETSDIFTINPYSSMTGTTLSRTKSLDREKKDVYHLQIWANTPSTVDSERIQNITIIVTDVNDNAPVFDQEFYNITIQENISPGSDILTISAIDPDVDNIATFKLIPGSSSMFDINQNTGILSVIKPIDKEPGDEYIFYVIATDGEEDSYARVIVNVQDVNDHAPYFVTTNYVGAFSAALSPNNKIIQVSAIDNDYGDNAKIVYTITSGNNDQQFKIMDDGTIELARHLSDSNVESFKLQISIRDSGTPPLTGINKANVTLSVRTSSDNRPIFSRVDYKLSIKENTLDASLQVSARDATVNDENKITYAIPSVYNVSSMFKISTDGLITLNVPLDYEKQALYVFAVEASDSGLPPKVATAYVTVTVLDVNDNKPVFTNTSATISIKESEDAFKAIYEVSASDKDSPEYGSVHYRFLSGNDENTFFVNTVEGFVRANRPLDYEMTQSYTLTIGAFDSGVPSLRSTVPFTLEIIIEDVNDNPPKFDKEIYELTVTENTGDGNVVKRFTVTDKDSGKNKEFDVEIVGELARSNFEIVSANENGVYDLKSKNSIDYEAPGNLNFYLKAKDKGTPSLESVATVKILVNNVNDNPPRFQRNVSVVLTEPLKNDLRIFQAVATDSDVGPGGRLRYFISDGNANNAFKIEQFTGIVRVNNFTKLAYGKQYKLSIKAEDSFTPTLVSQPLVLTFITAVNLQLENTLAYEYQFKTILMLGQFSHLRNIEKIQVLVQLFKTSTPSFPYLTEQPPLPYYQVFFGEDENKVRRYVALDIPLPITRRIQRRAVEQIPDEIEVTIGEDRECDKKESQNLLICNGPLIPGEKYRLQVHVYEEGNSEPFQSHFSQTVQLKAASTSGSISSPQLSPISEDGMLAMAATFGLVYITAVLVILIFVYWKQRHELIHIDHLRERRDVFDSDANFFSGKEFYATSDLGSISKKYPQFDDESLVWPTDLNSSNNSGGNILHPIEENDEILQRGQREDSGTSNEGFLLDGELAPGTSKNDIPNALTQEGDTDEATLPQFIESIPKESNEEVIVFDDKSELNEESDENHETASNEPIYESADRIRDAINLRNDQGKGKIRKTYADSQFELNLYSDSSEYSMRKGLIRGSKSTADEDPGEDDDGAAILL